MSAPFRVTLDRRAREWLEARPRRDAHVIAYDMTRCCGGGRICQVSVRPLRARDRVEDFARAALDDGTTLLVDPRAAVRLPERFGLTVRGVGPLRHLDLELAPEQWGALLYD